MDLRRTYYDKRERIWLFIYLVAMFASAGLIGWMLVRAFNDSAITFAIYSLTSRVGIETTALAAVGLGIYFGFLILLFIDSRKRTQSVILTLSAVITLGALGVAGIFLPALSPIDLLWVFLGLFIGVVFGAGIDQLRELEVADPHTRGSDRLFGDVTFETAERRLYMLIMAVVIFGFFDAHIDLPRFLGGGSTGELVFSPESFLQMEFVGTNLLAVDIPTIVIFGTTLFLFLGYESSRRYFVAGPTRSGKTHFMVGLVKKMKDRDMKTQGGGRFVGLLEEIAHRGEWGDATETVDENMEDYTGEDSQITVRRGRFFPRDYTIDAVDYPGEIFPFLPVGLMLERDEISESEAERHVAEIDRKMEGMSDTPTFSEDHSGMSGDGGADIDNPESTASDDTQPSDELNKDEILAESEGQLGDMEEETAEETEDDSEAVGPDFEGHEGRVEAARNIAPNIEKADSLVLVLDMERFVNPEKRMETEFYSNFLEVVDDKDVIYVAAKSDYLLEEFEESRYEGQLSWAEKKEPFRRFVNGKLESHPAVNLILGDEMPYPVFFKTTDDYELQIVGQNFQVYGFEDVLDRLSR